jgi:hypothetical protein
MNDRGGNVEKDNAIEKDLDETRRLLYGCIVASRTKRWEVVGTVANALLHHGHNLDVEPAALLDRLVDVVDGNDAVGKDWLFEQVDRITALLAA